MSSRVWTDEELATHSVAEFPYHQSPAQGSKPFDGELVAASQVAQAEKASFEEGYRQGQRAGLAAAEQRLAPTRKRLEATIAQLSNLKQTLFARAEPEVVRLALSVAAKLVRREIGLDKEIVTTLIRICLEKTAQASAVKVRLNPDEYKYLMSAAADDKHSGFASGVVLVEDPRIEPGGCVVESDAGFLDARIGSQLEEVAETLLSTF